MAQNFAETDLTIPESPLLSSHSFNSTCDWGSNSHLSDMSRSFLVSLQKMIQDLGRIFGTAWANFCALIVSTVSTVSARERNPKTGTTLQDFPRSKRLLSEDAHPMPLQDRPKKGDGKGVERHAKRIYGRVFFLD